MTVMKKTIYVFLIFILAITLFSCGSEENEAVATDEIPIEETVIDNSDAETAVKSDNSDDQASSTTFWLLIVLSIILGPGLIFFFWYYIPIGLWYEAWLSGVRVGWLKLLKMRFQKIPQDLMLKTLIEAQNAGLSLKSKDLMEKYLADVDIDKVVETAIRAVNAGIDIDFNDLAAQYLAKVDVETVMHALITAQNANLNLTIKELASHYLANVDIMKVVEALITAHNSGYDNFTLDELKEHYLANGDVTRTVDAFVAAKKAKLHEVEFQDIAAIDLAGLDVTKAIEAATNPRVIETPEVSGVARDGVQLFMKLKLTVRANLKNIIGGATEATVLARVDESIGTAIGKSPSHYDVLESPFKLADVVEQRQLGEGTAFDVISVDVSDIRVGKDVHAELQTERAHAKAEVAKAELIRAEEKVKKAMAAAFINGKLSVNEYHELKNTEADTHMRKKIGDSAVINEEEEEHNEHEHDDEHEHHH